MTAKTEIEAVLEDEIDDDDYLVNEIQAEEISILDLATSHGYSLEWAENEILYTTAMMGLIALEQEGNGAKTARFTIDLGEDVPVEITVRLQEERKKKRLN
jgi:hypothetical protein